jgi:large-conductance mechanosensitive channel
MGLVTWIIVIIVFLAILGLGCDTFFLGVRKGADRIGIGSILETAINTTTGLVKNASQEITGSSSNLLSLVRADNRLGIRIAAVISTVIVGVTIFYMQKKVTRRTNMILEQQHKMVEDKSNETRPRQLARRNKV